MARRRRGVLGQVLLSAALAHALCLLAMAASAQGTACMVTGIEGQGASAVGPRGELALMTGALPPDVLRIETAAARVELRCSGDVVVTLGRDTGLDLARLGGLTPGLLLRLWRGVVGVARPEGAPGGVAVETDLAIASARSTEWAVIGDSATAVFVHRGQVLVERGTGAATLGAGEGVDATVEGLGSVVEWGPDRIKELRQALGFGWR